MGQSEGNQQLWLDVEDRARVNLQSVDGMVETGHLEVYDQFEQETI